MTYHFPKKILGSRISLTYKRLMKILRRTQEKSYEFSKIGPQLCKADRQSESCDCRACMSVRVSDTFNCVSSAYCSMSMTNVSAMKLTGDVYSMRKWLVIKKFEWHTFGYHSVKKKRGEGGGVFDATGGHSLGSEGREQLRTSVV